MSSDRKNKEPKADPNSPFAKLRGLKDALAREAEEKAAAQKTAAQKAKGKPLAHSAAYETPRGPEAYSSAYKAASKAGSSGDDALSFARMMMGVTPLDAKATRVAQGISATVERKPAHDRKAEHEAQLLAETEAVHEQLRALAMGGTKFEVSDDGANVEGRRVDVNPSLVRKLRRGQFPIDGRVDLHGFTAEDAKRELGLFLRRMRDKRELCVLIIHGKGDHSAGGLGVLRGEIAAWLSQGAASEHVAAFATAQEPDGGHGATYVLLRR